MNKLAIVGHPSTAYDTFAQQLAQRGFKPAQPSKREGLSPAEITATLCQSHKVPVQQPHWCPETLIAPLKIGAVWHGLALDLLLGNLEQKAWYWADPWTVFVLDYWRVADPELGFVLLYEDPAQALLLNPSDPPTSPQVMLDHWVAYHRVLLAFYHHHRQRCVLMHARQASQLMDPHWQQLQSLLDMPPLETAPPPAQPASTSHPDWTLQPLAATLAQLDSANEEQLNLLTGRTIESYLSADLLAMHPASAQLYEELQAAANVPWDAERPKRPEAAQAWQGLLQQRQQLNALFAQLISEKDSLNEQLQQAKDANTKAQAELTSQLEQHQTHNLKELKEENELLLLQLHQVQEELERYFLENQALKNGKAVSAPTLQVPQPASRTYYGAAERIKRQLTYRLGAIMVSHSHKPADWLRIPGALLREVRQFKREAPERAAQKLPPIHTYADAYEAERVKRHLSYRLGVVLMEHSRSPKGWLTMPWAMHKAVHEFRADRQQAGK